LKEVDDSSTLFRGGVCAGGFFLEIGFQPKPQPSLLRGGIMPLYEYICHKCGHKYSRVKLYSDKKHLEPCPKCGALNERKLGNIAHFEFKGNLA